MTDVITRRHLKKYIFLSWQLSEYWHGNGYDGFSHMLGLSWWNCY